MEASRELRRRRPEGLAARRPCPRGDRELGAAGRHHQLAGGQAVGKWPQKQRRRAERPGGGRHSSTLLFAWQSSDCDQVGARRRDDAQGGRLQLELGRARGRPGSRFELARLLILFGLALTLGRWPDEQPARPCDDSLASPRAAGPTEPLNSSINSRHQKPCQSLWYDAGAPRLFARSSSLVLACAAHELASAADSQRAPNVAAADQELPRGGPIGPNGTAAQVAPGGRRQIGAANGPHQRQLQSAGRSNTNNNNERTPSPRPEQSAADLEQTTAPLTSARPRARQEVDPNSPASGGASSNLTAQMTETAGAGAGGEAKAPLQMLASLRQHRKHSSLAAAKRRPGPQDWAAQAQAQGAAAQMSSRDEHKGRQSAELSGPMSPMNPLNPVVCNSRCRCVQLELGPAAGEPAELNEIESAPGEPARNETTTTTAPSHLGAEIGATNSSNASNRRALIEFSRDYSFEEEEGEEEAAKEACAEGEEDERPAAGEAARPEAHDASEGAQPLLARLDGRPAEDQRGPVQGGNGRHQAASAGGNVDRLAASLFSAPSSPSPLPPPAAAASAPSSSEPTIKHANDQSKVVNVSSAPPAATARGPPADPPMLSIKDNKTATPPPATTAQVKSADRAGDAATDKENLGLSTAPAGANASASRQTVNFYPLLAARRHHQHHNHHYLQHHQHQQQYRGQASSMPAPFLIESGHEGAGPAPARDESDADEALLSALAAGSSRLRRIQRIAPLRSSAATSLGPPEAMVQLLDHIERDQVQSLSLRGHHIKFELWTEVYGLLALPLRRHLYHLDLSRNSLLKLGVTFTGYIEHHLAYQLLAHRNQTWPFSAGPLSISAAPGGAPQVARQQQPLQLQGRNSTGHLSSNYFKLIQLKARPPPALQSAGAGATPVPASARARPNSAGSLRHPNLGDGRLYNEVRARRPLELGQLSLPDSQPNEPGERQHLRPNLQASSVLHQAARLKALDLSHNKLRWLINEQFRVLKHLEAIRLDHNQIRYIHAQAFQGLEALKYVNLNQNRIQTIYVEQFQTNYNLRALSLQSNYLTYLRAGAFASLARLKRLELSKNKFTLLSNNAFVGLDSLELLNLSSNQFAHVPSSSLHALAGNLKRLDLSRNQLGQLMPGTFFHMKLEQLWLAHNGQLAAIDRGAFWDLPYLRQLSLGPSQMLVSVNSQAFVGVPNLVSIQVDECPMLEQDARQVLDNVTSAATLRQLKQAETLAGARPQTSELVGVEQQQQLASRSAIAALLMPTSSPVGQRTAVASLLPLANSQQAGDLLAGGQPVTGLQPLKWTLVKFVYPAAWVLLFVAALKLVFKFTSTRHYLEARRRRRRVYQTASSSSASSNDDVDDDKSSLGGSLSDRRPDRGGGDPEDDDDLASSLNGELEQQMQRQGCGNQAMAMREQQPHSVIRRSLVAPLGPTDEAAGDAGAPDGSLLAPIDLERALAMSSKHTQPPAADECQCLETADLAGRQFDECAGHNFEPVGCPDCSCCSEQQLQGARLNSGAYLDSIPRHQPVPPGASSQDTHCDSGASTSPQGAQAEVLPIAGDDTAICHLPTGAAATTATPDDSAAGQAGPPTHKHLDLIHNQLVAAGFDYGHANCDHFYQSLGPALQLADLEANFVNQMDYYS